MVLLGAAAVAGGMLLFVFLRYRQSPAQMRKTAGRAGQRDGQPDLTKLRSAKRRKSKNAPPTLEERFFRAGWFLASQRKQYATAALVSPIVGLVVGLAGGLAAGASMFFVVLLSVTALYVGYLVPDFYLSRKIKIRNEEILYYLPLVIEQVVIGVSSSLDVGPCLQRIVQLATERGSHNAVSELFRISQLYMKSGISMEESLGEVARLSGHNELKHAFLSLAQVAKHGGEISRQLQELADSVSNQRETAVDAKIKKLELSATGPVAMVFFAFIITLLAGLGGSIMKAFVK